MISSAITGAGSYKAAEALGYGKHEARAAAGYGAGIGAGFSPVASVGIGLATYGASKFHEATELGQRNNESKALASNLSKLGG